MEHKVSVTLHLRVRNCSRQYPPPIPTAQGIPLFTLALAPSTPITIGTTVTAVLLRPMDEEQRRGEGADASRRVDELGVEGVVFAARRVDSLCAEILIRNMGPGRPKYVAILIHALPGIIIGKDLMGKLRSPTAKATGWEGLVTASTNCYWEEGRLVMAQYPPVIERNVVDETLEEGWLTSKRELGELSRRMGVSFQSFQIPK
ncbi:hypothetical protein C2E23DRAFT_732861 [Lenzites betulinus]|nr:hypothetical protein C2E23DRAFT_732861 [Lenzites betulinus]